MRIRTDDSIKPSSTLKGSTSNNILTAAYSLLFLVFSAGTTAVLMRSVPITSVDIEVQSYKQVNEVQLFYDAGNGINEADSIKLFVSNINETNREISFEIPFYSTIRTLRLDPWPATGDGAIRSISPKYLLLTLHSWDSRGIIRDFVPNNAISSFTDKGGLVRIESRVPDPSIACLSMEKIYADIPPVYILMVKSSLILLLLIICAGAGVLMRGIIADPSARNVINTVAATLFITAISLPLINTGFHLTKELRDSEYRELAMKPKFDMINMRSFFRKYENYFSDHLGFKNHLLLANSLYRYFILGASPVPYVVPGKNEWTFFRSEYYWTRGDSMNDWMGLVPFSQNELEQIKKNIESQRNYLKKKRIPYLLLIAPNKETIYPEFIPDYFKKVRPTTRLDQLVRFMKNKSDIEIIDVRNELILAKNRYDVFYRYDSHWNIFGAYITYRKLRERMIDLFPDILVNSVENNYIVPVKSNLYIPDLARMMGLLGYLNEKFIWVINQNQYEPVKTRKIRKAVFFHDSFGDPMSLFLKNDIETIYKSNIINGFNRTFIDRVQPSLVIVELVERAQGLVLLDIKKM